MRRFRGFDGRRSRTVRGSAPGIMQDRLMPFSTYSTRSLGLTLTDLMFTQTVAAQTRAINKLFPPGLPFERLAHYKKVILFAQHVALLPLLHVMGMCGLSADARLPSQGDLLVW